MKNNNNQRTGIQAGDLVVYYKTGNMISVFRPSESGDTTLRTEFGDNKLEVNISNTAFIMMLCQITGLQAVQIQNDEQITKWSMQEGDSLFSETASVPKENNEIIPSTSDNLSLADREKEIIEAALKKHKGRRRNAAAELGISERTLYRKCREYNLF